jgi:hypothetical protein
MPAKDNADGSGGQWHRYCLVGQQNPMKLVQMNDPPGITGKHDPCGPRSKTRYVPGCTLKIEGVKNAITAAQNSKAAKDGPHNRN